VARLDPSRLAARLPNMSRLPYIQRFPYAHRNHGGIVVYRKRHRTLEAARPCDEHAKATPERIGGDPCCVRSFGVFATRDDGRFDELTTVAGNSLAVEDRERHTVQL